MMTTTMTPQETSSTMAPCFSSTAEEMNPSRRSTMEDCHVIHAPDTWNCPDPNMAYLGVYDGHGGRELVDFLEESLAQNVAQELQHHDDDASIHTRLERAFLWTDVCSRQMGITTSGATVAIALVQSQPDSSDVIIHTANAGDARIVLGKASQAITTRSGRTSSSSSSSTCPSTDVQRLTHDHRADDREELHRITTAGGFVLKSRVVGILAVARSLGDHGMKDFVIARPYTQTHVKANKGDILILACDGLWDVLADDEAISFVLGWRGNRSDTARGLVREAMKRGSTDNITVIVYWL